MTTYELLRWWAYRNIKHDKMRIYVWIIPCIIAAIFTITFLLLPVRPDISGKDGLLLSIVQILALLPGFFIASLAAVATFQRSEMDVQMPDPAPTLELEIHGEKQDVPLTRRMFLSYLFSYLAITSLALVVFCIVSNLLVPSAIHLIGQLPDKIIWIQWPLILFFLFFIFYWCASIIITTLHGIYFLVERMHQPS